MSFDVVGLHDVDGPDLRDQARELRSSLEGIKARHRREGWLGWDQWLLMQVTPDGRQRSWVYDDGVVEERRWDEAVDGVPDRFDTVRLSSGLWGRLDLGAPSLSFLGRDVRSLSASVESPAAGVEDAAAVMLDRLVAGAGVPGVLTGFVHIDSVPDPYGDVVTRRSRLSEDRFDVEVHGYYWSVVLTDGHLERLGGLARVRREAPCARVEVLDLGDRRGVLCQLTESPLDLDATRVLAWREFLLPVLRAGYPVGWESVGERRTPLHRPVWLFEGAPVPGGTRFILDVGHAASSPPLEVEWSSHVQDPEWPTCWLYPGPAFDREQHSDLVSAVVNAWYVTGVRGRLFEVEGVLYRATLATWDSDDDGVDALAWQVDVGSCDVDAAVDLLAAALSELDGVLGGDVFDRLRVG